MPELDELVNVAEDEYEYARLLIGEEDRLSMLICEVHQGGSVFEWWRTPEGGDELTLGSLPPSWSSSSIASSSTGELPSMSPVSNRIPGGLLVGWTRLRLLSGNLDVLARPGLLLLVLPPLPALDGPSTEPDLKEPLDLLSRPDWWLGELDGGWCEGEKERYSVVGSVEDARDGGTGGGFALEGGPCGNSRRRVGGEDRSRGHAVSLERE